MLDRSVLVFAMTLAWVSLAVGAEPFQANVTDVVKGDVLVIAHGGKTETVRLSGVDSPELAQHFGPEAKKFTSDLVLGKEVTFVSQGTDGLGRIVAVATLGDGRVLNQEILDAGLGWYCDKHPDADPKLRGVVAKAIAIKKGLWSDPTPLAPVDFRGDALKERVEAPVTVEQAHENDPAKPLKTVSAKGDLEGIEREQFPKPVPRDLAKFKEDPMVKQLGIAPHNGANGKMDGIQAGNLGAFGPLAAAFGFQDGDVLHSVNGDVIDSEGAAFDLYNKYKDSRTFQVGIIRNGQPQTLNVTVPDFIK
jgi:micrococcal nuclease